MRHSLRIITAASLLAGCGGTASPVTMQALPAQVRALPAKSGGDLLYAIDSFRATVDVYTYPGSKLVGTLRGFVRPSGLCADKSGNVFVTDEKAYDIVEYAHGGTTPIAKLTESHASPESNTAPGGCAVDPATGDLAVANPYVWGNRSSIWGNVAIFKHARGEPKIYTDYPEIAYYNSCTYDDKGNLYIEGDTASSSALAELRKGASTITNITLNKSFEAWGGVQWDGRYVALQRYRRDNNVIYRVAVSGVNGTIVGTVATRGARYIGGFWIEGGTVIVLNGLRRDNEVGTWSYPSGGSPKSEFKVRGSWFDAAVVSHG